MKTCRRCKTEKPDEEFTKRRGTLTAACSECLNEAKRDAYRNRPGDKQAAIDRARRGMHARKQDPAYRNAWNAWRKAKAANRAPMWVVFTRDLLPIYARSAALGDGFVVDHIIPLRGALVSGLHVPSNLRITSAAANEAKGDFFDESWLPLYDRLARWF